ncbi:MAG: extracellular solute-binding protein [Deltaproteobacteria bacterium]|nr:extracellular solute-binding protein [Deltaproteobacteria bacterium]
MRRIPAITTFFGAVWIYWLLPSWALASSPEIIEGAKKEGEVIWYGGGSSEIDEVMNKGFMKKYPFVQAKKFRIQSQKLLVRFEAESRAGKHVADIVRTTDWYIDIFKKKGLLMRYESQERKSYAEGLKDPDAYYTSLYIFLHVMAYNTKLVPKSEGPRSYDDLLDPKWKGRLGLEDGAYVWFVNLLKLKGERQGHEFMKRLAGQNVNLRSGTTLLANLVVAGEIPIAIDLYAYQVERSKKKGAPIDWVAVEPAIVHAVLGGISKNTPHPNAAKLFMDYLLSEEGQRVYLSEDNQPARRGLYAPWFPKGIKLHLNNPEMGDKFGDTQRQFHELFSAARPPG